MGRKNFLAINCAALPGNLFESELFGYKKGAFTGAVQDKPGLIKQAEGGILFLDEIGGLTPEQQGKILRLLQKLPRQSPDARYRADSFYL
jgi:transcriptional regulator with PAS, ATPase and Fis domain